MALYIVQTRESKRIKIGFTQDNRSGRVRQLQTSSPECLDLLYFVPKVGRTCERLLHSIHSDYRITGEWFKPEGSVLKMLHALATQGSDGLAAFLQENQDPSPAFNTTKAVARKPALRFRKKRTERKVTVLRQCKTEKGWRRFPVVWNKGAIIPNRVLCENEERDFEVGYYQLRYFVEGRTIIENIGNDPVKAMDTLSCFSWSGREITHSRKSRAEYAALETLFSL